MSKWTRAAFTSLLYIIAAPICFMSLANCTATAQESVPPAATPTYLPLVVTPATPRDSTLRFAVIGDYGSGSANEDQVATMVKRWQPEIIITTGDNNYSKGESATIDPNIGHYYSPFIYPYYGTYASGGDANRFFPALGNHDWQTGDIQPYLDYFPISESRANTGSSGNERYYDFVEGPVHFFVLDSDPHEPDGTSADSPQAMWLKTQLAASTAPWQIVYFHHPPYSSAKHGSQVWMQWPFAQWGADAVLSGHDHTYERLSIDGIPYFVNGLGGQGIYPFKHVVPGSQVRYNDEYGAMLVTATPTQIIFEFYSIRGGGALIDQYTLSSK